MKSLSRWIVLSLLAAAGAASAVNMPLRIPFQGKLIDPTDNSPRNGNIVVTFRLYDVPTGGLALYTEPMTVAVNNGVFAVQIGTSALLDTDLFSHASAYLGITVSGDTEMLPRQPLTMSAYAFTAMQLASPSDIRVNAGTSYSTFTAQGNLTMQYGIVAGTGTYAVLTSTGVGAFGIVTSSGISMGGGTLKIEADSKGIDATGTGITAATGTFTSSVTAKQFFGIGATTAAIKLADTSRTNNTLADDPHLAIPIGANETYAITGMFKSSSTSATPDLKIAFTVPAGGTLDIIYFSNGGTLATFTTAALRDSGVAGPVIPIGVSIIDNVMVSGTVVNGGTPGFLTLRWAQNTTNATATTMTAGSYLAATRIR
jgi:hypothetical protein